MSTRSLVVSLIGRPNVGKSSLYNRLIKSQNRAITFDTPGVTRDRHYGLMKLNELSGERPCEIILVDTGGFLPEADNILENTDQNQPFFNIMVDHAHCAIEESDLVCLVVDGREGLAPFDSLIAKIVREKKKDFWILVNKIDGVAQEGLEFDFYELGIDSHQLFPVSAAHGRGIEGLRESLQEYSLLRNKEGLEGPGLTRGITPREEVVARLSIVGVPNAGKSTLLNQLVGSDRALVSDIAGTTVDPIEGYFDIFFGEDATKLGEEFYPIHDNKQLFNQYEDFRKNNPEVFAMMANEIEDAFFAEDEENLEAIVDDIDVEQVQYEELFGENSVDADAMTEDVSDEDLTSGPVGSFWRSVHIVDTAGIRKANKIDGFIESQSVYRALRCITESDIVLYVVDATKGIGHQDRRLIDIALEKGKSVIVCLNKIDLLQSKLKTPKERREWMDNLRSRIPWLAFCDLVPISAKRSMGLGKLKRCIKDTVLIRRTRVSTGELNRLLLELLDRNPVMMAGKHGGPLKLKYGSMVKNGPPTFLLFVNKSKSIPDNYRRYLVNGIRKHFVLRNCPVHLVFRRGNELKEQSQAPTNS